MQGPAYITNIEGIEYIFNTEFFHIIDFLSVFVRLLARPA